jgi:hypothetical protein
MPKAKIACYLKNDWYDCKPLVSDQFQQTKKILSEFWYEVSKDYLSLG